MHRTGACLLAFVLAAASTGQASACPGDNREVSTDSAPTAVTPCMEPVDFHVTRRAVDVTYGVGAGGTSQTGIGSIASMFASAGLGYRLLFGDEAQPSYEAEADAGVTVEHYGGAVSSTGLVTQLSGHLGPAQMAPSMVDEGTGSIAVFPLTMELAHTGELAGRPRMSSRPELARAQYTRERLELTTRIVRVEGAGAKPASTAPGATPPATPTSWAIDAIPLHAGLDIAAQTSSRVETTIGGAMLGATEHVSGTSLQFFEIEHQRIDLPMTKPTDLDEVWMLRVEGANPLTGGRYTIGWGEVIGMPDRDALANRIDAGDTQGKHIYIGGIGWYSKLHPWGGWGLGYKRDPFVNIAGAVAIEDRVSAEVFCPHLLNLVLAAFAARTTRLVDNDLVHQGTAGVSIDASYTHDGVTSKLGVEVGRTFYSSLDGEMPDSAGFGAAVGLSIQHTGGHTWMR